MKRGRKSRIAPEPRKYKVMVYRPHRSGIGFDPFSVKEEYVTTKPTRETHEWDITNQEWMRIDK